jgi:hypothetical protein
LVFFTSAMPSGEPCALKLSCSGEPKPRCVRTRTSVGRAVSAHASASAASIASTSLPSSTPIACQQYA